MTARDAEKAAHWRTVAAARRQAVANFTERAKMLVEAVAALDGVSRDYSDELAAGYEHLAAIALRHAEQAETYAADYEAHAATACSLDGGVCMDVPQQLLSDPDAPADRRTVQ